MAQAIAASLAEAERERQLNCDEDDFMRMLEASAREASEVDRIRTFVSNPGTLKSVLRDLPGVDPEHSSFREFYA
jgi:hypothetical protein